MSYYRSSRVSMVDDAHDTCLTLYDDSAVVTKGVVWLLHDQPSTNERLLRTTSINMAQLDGRDRHSSRLISIRLMICHKSTLSNLDVGEGGVLRIRDECNACSGGQAKTTTNIAHEKAGK